MSKFLVFTATCFLIVLVNLTDGCNLKTSEKMFADDSGIPWPCRSYCPGIRGCMSKCCPTKEKVNEGRNRNGTMSPRLSSGSKKKSVLHYGPVTPQSSPGPKKTPIWHYGPVTPRASPDPRKKPIWHYGSVTPRASPGPKKKTTLPYGHANTAKLKESPQNKKVWYLLVVIFLTSGCLLVIGGKEIWDKLKNRTGNSMEDVEAQREDVPNELRSEFPLMEGSENLPPERIAQETENEDLSNDLRETSL